MRNRFFLLPIDRIPQDGSDLDLTGMSMPQMKQFIEDNPDLTGEYAVVQVLKVFRAELVRNKVVTEVDGE